MGFESMALELLSEERVAARTVEGHFAYVNPTRDEIIRACYDSDYNNEGCRALYIPDDERMFVCSNMVLHVQMKDALLDSPRDSINALHLTYMPYAAIVGTTHYLSSDIKKGILKKLHAPESTKFDIQKWE